MRAIPKPTRETDSGYTDFVKSKPCCLLMNLFEHACTVSWLHINAGLRSEAHHVSPRNGTKSAASKVSDRRQVPVCFNGHRYCEAHPVEVLPYLNTVIRRLNREYDAAHPEPKKERIIATTVRLTVRHCICGQEHSLPFGKVEPSKAQGQDRRVAQIRFRCPVRNEAVVVNL